MRLASSVGVLLRLRRRQVDLVEHRDDREVVLHRQVEVGLLGVGIVDVITPPLCRVAGQLESEARTSPGASGAGRKLRAGRSPLGLLVHGVLGDPDLSLRISVP